MATESPNPLQPRLSPYGQALALAHFHHVEQQVTLATTTATLLVAADTLIIGAYTTVATQYKVFHVLGWSPAGMGFAVGGGLLIVGFVLALLAAFPNVRFRGFCMDVGGVFYFGKIGSQDFEAYVREFHACDQGHALDRELLSQVWAKSRWLLTMFRFIQGAIGCTLAGTLVSVAILLAVAHRL